MRKTSKILLTACLALGMALSPLAAMAEDEQTGTSTTASASATLQITTETDVVEQLGVLKGDGDGVTDEFLAKQTTRVQGAILMLRLLGKEQEAMAYTGMDNFSDASSVGASNRAVLAYLKSHPELGWIGTSGGLFSPNAPITAQQVYKVMLESLLYRQGTDFEYADTLSFAASKGLSRAADADPFTNRDLAVALTEVLQATPKGANESVAQMLVANNVIAADKAALLRTERVELRSATDGSMFLTDGNGMALYLFTKDTADLNSCQGQCLVNWPIFGSDSLILGEGLDAKDFGAFVRTDGTKQITFQGWPLYYFVKDQKAGDILGEGVGQVWYLIKEPFYSVTVGTDPKLGNYLVDANGMSLYYFDKDPQGASVCAGECLKNWPAFHTNSVVVPSGLKAEDFGEIIRTDGTKQTTFKGYPLYYWVQDAKRGEVKGHDVGKVWFVVNPETFAGTAADQAVSEKVTIEMKNYAFSTAEVTVKAGATITFINRDDDEHNAVAVDGTFKTSLISQGESVTIKLDKPGTYEYYCEPHKEHMKGKIIVQ